MTATLPHVARARTRRVESAAKVGAIVLGLIAASALAGEARVGLEELQSSMIFVKVTATTDGGVETTATGSGFIITRDGYAVTANHLLANPRSSVQVTVGSRQGVVIRPEVIPTGPQFADVALIKLPRSLGPYKAVTFAPPQSIGLGGNLAAIGFPLQSDVSVVRGTLSNMDGPGGLWQVAIPLNYGNSGGPVTNSTGSVVGMVRGGVADAQLVNFMIPLNLLSPILIAAGLRWPPFEAEVSVASSPIAGPPITTTTTVPTSGPIPPNCSEVVVVTGLPPKYSKRLECN
jgi:S1-C subfamily serine protease